MALIELITSSIADEFHPVLQLWKDMTDAPFGGVILAWAVITFLGAMTVIKLRTTNGLMLGFIITISGALIIFVNISTETLKAKKEITHLENRLSNLQVKENSINEVQQDKQHLETVHTKNTLNKKRDKLLAIIEIGTILTNFSSMTLGGLGAGLLTSAALTRRNRDEELEIESPGRRKLLTALLYIFSFAAISSITTGTGVYALFSAKCIAVYPMIGQFTAALVGFAITLPIALVGCILAYKSLQTDDLKIAGAILTMLTMLLIYGNSMSAAVFYTGHWLLLANTALILVFKTPREWTYKKLATLV